MPNTNEARFLLADASALRASIAARLLAEAQQSAARVAARQVRS